MLIHAHRHLWHYDQASFECIDPSTVIAADFLIDDLAAELRSNAVDGCIAVQARQCETETRWLLSCARASPCMLGVVGWVDLRADDVERRIAAVADTGLVGVRHVVQDETDDRFLLGPEFSRGVRAALGRGFAYDLLVNHAQLAHLPAFLELIGPGTIVLDRAAKPVIASAAWQPWADRIAEIAKFPFFFCKVSGLLTQANYDDWSHGEFGRYLEHILICFGAERLIWGSDWPVCRLAGSCGDTTELIRAFVDRTCPRHHAAIFRETAYRAYRLGEANAL